MPETPIADQAEGQSMLYSSGTTGYPKGVKKPLPETPYGEPAAPNLLGLLYGADERFHLSVSGAAVSRGSAGFTMGCLRHGTQVVVMEHFDAERALEYIERYRITHSQWVPTMFVRMLKLPEEVRARYDVSSLQCAIHAAAPCPIPVKEQMIEWWGPVLYEYYAGTEGNGFVQLEFRRVAGAQGLGRQAAQLRDSHLRRRRQRTAGRRVGHHLLRRRRPVRVPQRSGQDRPVTPSQGLDHARRRGLPRRGRLPLPDRPQALHDHLRRGEHLSPGSGERADHPSGGDGRGRVRRAERGVRRGGEGRRAAAGHGGAGAGAGARAHGPGAATGLSHIKCPRSVDFRPELPRHPTGKLYKRLLKDEYWGKA
jgi:long-chain acyl-CoA synthetase